MTRVEFYLLPANESAYPYACRLAEKAYRQGHTVFLLTDSAEDAGRLDDLLWTFRQGSFIPHGRVDAGAGGVPVGIGHGAPPEAFGDVMINLSSRVPEAFGQFRRVIELVDPDESARELSREHFRLYRHHGLNPEMVAIEQKG
jgi:DNA polymerase IIIc chi subunit